MCDVREACEPCHPSFCVLCFFVAVGTQKTLFLFLKIYSSTRKDKDVESLFLLLLGLLLFLGLVRHGSDDVRVTRVGDAQNRDTEVLTAGSTKINVV